MLLAGCGGPQIGASQSGAPALPPLDHNAFGGASPSYIADTGALKGEKFSSPKVSDNCSTGAGPHGGTKTLTFRVSGTASGPFPGTFSTRGWMVIGFSGAGFHERFNINSGSRMISGGVLVGQNFGFPDCPKYHNVPFFAKHVSYKSENSQGITSLRYTKGRGFTQTFK
jgi:hypothetical protein